MNGRDVLKLPSSGAKHRSETLADFILVKTNASPDPLNCWIHCTFEYDNEPTKAATIHLVYPSDELVDPIEKVCPLCV